MTTPQFEAHEVFTCIEMDKETTFILVEGNEVDVYDNVLRGLLGLKGLGNIGWIVESGADKRSILDFRKKTKADNFYAILDADFDDTKEKLDRVEYLDRYSIENYMFDDMVIRQATTRLFKKALDRVELNTEHLRDYYADALTELLGFVKAYQLSQKKKTISWSDEKLLIKDCWRIADDTISQLIERVKEDHPDLKPLQSVKKTDFIKTFPGKLLVRGIYHYLKKELKPPKFTTVFNNENVFLNALFGSAESSLDFVQCLTGAHAFLLQRQEANKN